MTSTSCNQRPDFGRPFLRARALCGTFLLLSCSLVFAQPAPSPTPVDKNYGFVRLINLCPPGSPALDFDNMSETPSTWIQQLRPLDYTTYAFFRPGSAKINIKSASGDIGPAFLKIKPGDYYTLLMFIKDGKVTPIIENDSYPYDSKALGTLRVISGLPDVSAEIIPPGPSNGRQKINYLTPVVLTGLPQQADVKLEIKEKTRNVEFDFPLDFRGGKRMTILIVKDSYDRIRPVNFYDGFSGDVFATPE